MSIEVALDGVAVRFGDRVIGPVSVTLGPGINHLQGPSGAGKSTLIRLICGEVRCRVGTVRVAGRDPFADAAVRAHIGLLSTHPQLPGFLTADEVWRWHAVVRGRPSWDGTALREALALPAALRLERASVNAPSCWQPWPATPRCCCSTSPSPTSTRPPPTRSPAGWTGGGRAR